MNKKNYKIGILTYHSGYNYGASLQAFALQTVIKNAGYFCQIINFETPEFVSSREMFAKNPKRLKEFIKIISRIPYYSSLKKRQLLFDKFTNEKLSITKLIDSEEKVPEEAEKFDCIVCGSDQIWNYGEKDKPAAHLTYFLNFPKKQRRISYAASFGNFIKEAPSKEALFLPWIKAFDAVSVREISGQKYLQSCGIDAKLTLDPTILLDKEEYEKICAPRLIKQKYICMFGWNTNKDLISVARRYSKLLHLPVFNIVPPPRGFAFGIKRKLDIGPMEFLSMIKNAELIVTNSFHGTAFSITFEKPFVSIISNGKADTRMESLLNQLDLLSQLIIPQEATIEKLTSINYSIVGEKKKLLRKDSLFFLSKSLVNEK